MSNIRTYRANHTMQIISVPLHSTTSDYHPGNNREVVDASGTVTQVTNYYPFGAPYADATASKGSDVQPYKYNGKELDLMHGLNTYDYGARQHDPILARWDRIDPLCEKFYSTSPYAYCENSPVNVIDPDGKKGVLVHGTWSNGSTWKDIPGLQKATKNLFNDGNIKYGFTWSGGNYRAKRTEAAKRLVNLLKIGVELGEFSAKEPITLIGHSHGGNVIIEAVNLMMKDPAFKDVKINILTINTPVRPDHQLSKTAKQRVNHVNVYDPSDPVQSHGGDRYWTMSKTPNAQFGYGEVGGAGRIFKMQET